MTPGARYSGARRATKKAPAAPSEAHVALWRKLVTKARPLAVDPLSDALGFVQAAEKASKAVAPLGHRDAASPFILLVRLGRRFLQLTGVQRLEEARAIAAWADAITETLDGLGRPSPRAPYAED